MTAAGRYVVPLIAVASIACGSSVDVIDPGPEPREETVIRIRADDPAVAEALGWQTGIPDAIVYLRRDADAQIRTLRTNEDGETTLGDLPSATYWTWGVRELTAVERAASGGAQVLGGGWVGGISRGSETPVAYSPDEPGSLVISEYHYHHPPVSLVGLPGYDAHMYIELYNNSDTTVYLDGKIIGSGFNYNLDAALWTCAETEPYRNEPTGVYAQFFTAFPGSGTQYPLTPGQAVVVADQAIDHSAFYAGLPDLRNADFEFAFPDRANNPDVPDLVDIGWKPVSGTRTERFVSLSDVPFVADPLDLESLPRVTPEYQGDFVLVPAEQIIDIASFTSSYFTAPRAAPLCHTLVHPDLDKVGGVLAPDESRPDGHLLSVRRKQLPNGKLQRTHATYADFEVGPRSPGTVP